MNILLTGFSGQLGKAIISSKPKDIKIICKDKLELDLLSRESCFKVIRDNRPDWIINCAAYTNVDKAEEEKELAYKVNSLAPKFLSEAIKNYGGDLLHISTDYVFDGKKNTPYNPSENKSPICSYGFTKAKGEDFIYETLSGLDKGNIIRTSWLMSSYGNNFALKMIQKLKSHNKLKIIYDQLGSPTTANTLAYACWKTIILKNKGEKLPPIMHFTNSGAASWYDIAISIDEIGKELNLLDETNIIIPIETKEYKSAAKRPNYSVLNSFESFDKLSIKPIYWREALKKVLLELKNLTIKN